LLVRVRTNWISLEAHGLTSHSHPTDFRHAAVFYDGDDGYVDGLLPFIKGGVEAGEPVLVMVPGPKGDALRGALGGDADDVHFADMAEVGANPARIIPAWRDFVTERAASGSRVRGIGEPIWAGRTPDELVECQHHEALINVAFAGGAPMDLICPYDTGVLDGDVVVEALRSHPVLLEGDSFVECADYEGVEAATAPFSKPLPAPPADALELGFDVTNLDALRGFIAVHSAEAGLSRQRRGDLVLAVNELASNSVRHGGGSGALRAWVDADSFVAEIRDSGQIDRPLAGREPPEADQIGGHGLWLVNQLCDLLQMRTFATGSVVRVHMHRDG
jgi:anti-sigma regulatory factor (Ser/Thr protein kinase)